MKYNMQSSEMEKLRGIARIFLACYKPFPSVLWFARFMIFTATLQLLVGTPRYKIRMKTMSNHFNIRVKNENNAELFKLD